MIGKQRQSGIHASHRRLEAEIETLDLKYPLIPPLVEAHLARVVPAEHLKQYDCSFLGSSQHHS